MKTIGLVMTALIGFCLLHADEPLRKVDAMLPAYADEPMSFPDYQPPIDTICLVFAGVDHENPQLYPNAKHLTDVIVGNYYFPVIIWETGPSWGGQALFSYWDDLFKFWSYPDSFTTANGEDTGRPAVCSDSHGNLHFVWHQDGNPDGYEIFYTSADLDTSAGVIQYNVQRPGTMLSETNGVEEVFPVIAIHEDNLCVVWTMGADPFAIMYAYYNDSTQTWAGPDTAYAGSMPGSWKLPCIAPDPVDGDMWVSLSFDYTNDGSMDIVALFYDASLDTWTDELAAAAPTMHPYCLPAIAADCSEIPHIVFQENLTNTGGMAGLSGWNQCGPAGTLYYIHKQGGSWSTPQKIVFPDTMVGRAAGYPSIGITSNDTIYFSVTLPESVTPDTGAYLPFNVHYAAVVPYSGELLYGGYVSDLPWGDSTNASYPHMTYRVPLDPEIPPPCEPGPGITWAQMVNALPPVDIYYCHKSLLPLSGITEWEREICTRPLEVTVYPNPFHERTEIVLQGEWESGREGEGEIEIFDVTGRKVRELLLYPSSFILPASLEWDGRDDAGHRVVPGVYFVKFGAGKKMLTRKIIMVK